MPVFNDSENMIPVVPEGDYIFCVLNFECKISNGPKTRGCDQFEVELILESSGKKITEYLTDAPTTSWKIDTFIKCAGVKLAKGEKFEFRQDLAGDGVRFIDPIGLRGWCRVTQEEVPANGQRKAFMANKIATFYTDKEKLAPKRIAEEDKPF
jgi:hypothetical protein